MINLNSFEVLDLQELAVTSTSASGNFASAATAAGLLANQCWVSNVGASKAYFAFQKGSAPTAVNAAPFGKQFEILPGQSVLVSKGLADYFAAICPAGLTTTLAFHAGIGV